ncbi:MAG: hypothetical protein LJE91_03490 [Gammaproteobacteria bacterium]|jgi:cytochrome c556|nr:hypothetical protein [Gammaproteobacteria bacterium]
MKLDQGFSLGDIMTILNPAACIILVTISLGCVSASAQETHLPQNNFRLSPQLIELLRAEMRMLLTGIQSIASGIATADWNSVADKSAQISASYILEQKLTPAQREELDTSLPEHFKRLDSEFHLEAKKLEAAATSHDQQLATFHCYRLIETCTSCHALYAASRFPGFKPSTEAAHGH